MNSQSFLNRLNFRPGAAARRVKARRRMRPVCAELAGIVGAGIVDVLPAVHAHEAVAERVGLIDIFLQR